MSSIIHFRLTPHIRRGYTIDFNHWNGHHELLRWLDALKTKIGFDGTNRVKEGYPCYVFSTFNVNARSLIEHSLKQSKLNALYLYSSAIANTKQVPWNGQLNHLYLQLGDAIPNQDTKSLNAKSIAYYGNSVASMTYQP